MSFFCSGGLSEFATRTHARTPNQPDVCDFFLEFLIFFFFSLSILFLAIFLTIFSLRSIPIRLACQSTNISFCWLFFFFRSFFHVIISILIVRLLRLIYMLCCVVYFYTFSMSSSGFFLLCLFLLRIATLEIYHKQSCALLLCFIFCNLSLFLVSSKTKVNFIIICLRSRKSPQTLVEEFEFRHHRVSFPCLLAVCFLCALFQHNFTCRQTDEKFHPKAAPQALKETWTKTSDRKCGANCVVFHTFAFFIVTSESARLLSTSFDDRRRDHVQVGKGSREKRESENVEQSEREKEGKKEKQFFMRFDDESFSLSWRMKNWASEGNFRYLHAKVASSFLP